MARVFGISYGNAYACMATTDAEGHPAVVRDYWDGSDVLATSIYFETADNILVGEVANAVAETFPEAVVRFPRQGLGKDTDVFYEFAGREFTAAELNALVAFRLKQMGEEQGLAVENIVLAIPAFFEPARVAAAVEMFERAKMHVAGVIAEPAAAAIAYLSEDDRIRKNETVLVCDLGATSLAVSILKVTAGPVTADIRKSAEILAAGGSESLGGQDWSQQLAQHLLELCVDETGYLPEEIDSESYDSISVKAELAKKKLSKMERAKVRLYINGSLLCALSVTREAFEQLTANLVSMVMTTVEDTLRRVNDTQIDTVLLVGGATYMPMIRNAMEARFPGKVRFEDPDQAIAKGAAIYGRNAQQLRNVAQ